MPCPRPAQSWCRPPACASDRPPSPPTNVTQIAKIQTKHDSTLSKSPRRRHSPLHTPVLHPRRAAIFALPPGPLLRARFLRPATRQKRPARMRRRTPRRLHRARPLAAERNITRTTELRPGQPRIESHRPDHLEVHSHRVAHAARMGRAWNLQRIERGRLLRRSPQGPATPSLSRRTSPSLLRSCGSVPPRSNRNSLPRIRASQERHSARPLTPAKNSRKSESAANL